MRATGRTLTLGEFTDLIINVRGDQFDTTAIRVLTKDGEELYAVGAVFGAGEDVLIEIERQSDTERMNRLVQFMDTLADGPQTTVAKKAKALLEELELE